MSTTLNLLTDDKNLALSKLKAFPEIVQIAENNVNMTIMSECSLMGTSIFSF